MLTFEMLTEQQAHHIYVRFCDLQTQIENLKGEILILKNQGTLDGHAWYKDGKYLYLVHHSDQHKEYIGADPAKQKEALAMLDRYQEWKMKNIELNNNIQQCKRVIENTVNPAWRTAIER